MVISPLLYTSRLSVLQPLTGEYKYASCDNIFLFLIKLTLFCLHFIRADPRRRKLTKRTIVFVY